MDFLQQYTGITHKDLIFLSCIIAYIYLKRRGLLPSVRQNLLNQHFGDLVGLLLILLGVAMIMVAPLYSNPTYYTQISVAAGGLISAGYIALKLKTSAPENQQVSTTTTSAAVAPIVQAPPSATQSVVTTDTKTVVQTPPPPKPPIPPVTGLR
jgi:hypothetical protein